MCDPWEAADGEVALSRERDSNQEGQSRNSIEFSSSLEPAAAGRVGAASSLRGW